MDLFFSLTLVVANEFESSISGINLSKVQILDESDNILGEIPPDKFYSLWDGIIGPKEVITNKYDISFCNQVDDFFTQTSVADATFPTQLRAIVTIVDADGFSYVVNTVHSELPWLTLGISVWFGPCDCPPGVSCL